MNRSHYTDRDGRTVYVFPCGCEITRIVHQVARTRGGDLRDVVVWRTADGGHHTFLSRAHSDTCPMIRARRAGTARDPSRTDPPGTPG